MNPDEKDLTDDCNTILRRWIASAAASQRRLVKSMVVLRVVQEKAGPLGPAFSCFI